MGVQLSKPRDDSGISDGQVRLPIRLLARDLHASEFPVLRYEIRWTPEQGRPKGK